MSDSDVIVDIETDDLAATIIHVAVVQNIKTGEQTVFTGENMADLPDVLRSARTIYGHNAVAFDIPVINRLLWGRDRHRQGPGHHADQPVALA
jgi:hypothetical protein